MESLMIEVKLAEASAIILGYGRAGETQYPLAGVLALLDAATRKDIASRYHTAVGRKLNEARGLLRKDGGMGDLTITLHEAPSDQAVANAIVASLRAEGERSQEEGEKEAKMAAHYEALVCLLTERAKSCPVYDLVRSIDVKGQGWNGVLLRDLHTSTDPDWPDSRPYKTGASAEQSAYLLADRVAEVAAYVDAKRAEMRAHEESVEMAKAAAEADRIEAAEATREQIRTWVSKTGESIGMPSELLRASMENRNVAGAIRRFLDERVVLAITEVIAPHGGSIVTDTYASRDDARAPTKAAYAIRDAIVAASDSISSAIALPEAVVTVSDFERYDVSKMEEVWRTGIDVRVDHPWFPDYNFGQRILTEPLNWPPAEDRDDNE